MPSGIYVRTKAHNKKISKALRKNHADFNGKNNPMFGKHHSKKTKRKLSKAFRKRWKNLKFREKMRKAFKERKGTLGKHWKIKLKLKWYQKLFLFIKKIWRKIIINYGS